MLITFLRKNDKKVGENVAKWEKMHYFRNLN